jgi:hypothetical protein
MSETLRSCHLVTAYQDLRAWIRDSSDDRVPRRTWVADAPEGLHRKRRRGGNRAISVQRTRSHILLQAVGQSVRVNVIEVATQLELQNWTLADWAEYFEHRSQAHKVKSWIQLVCTHYSHMSDTQPDQPGVF